MTSWQERTILLLGEEEHNILRNSHVLVVGLGGVGGSAAEALARAGIGEMTIIDGDTIDKSNINRQAIALHSNINCPKADVTKAKLLDINPELKITSIGEYFTGDMMDEIDLSPYDYIVDAIDTLTPKTRFLVTAFRANKKIVSSMGAGGKLDPTKIEIKDISKSYNCKLAQALRKRLYKRNIRRGIKVVFSPEHIRPNCFVETDGSQNKKSTIGTVSFLPPLFGLFCASVVINDLIKKEVS